MGTQPTFQQILEEKLGSPEGNSPEFGAAEPLFQRENTAFETLIASLLGGNVNFKFAASPEHVRRSYPTVSPREKPSKPRPAERTVLVKDLVPAAKDALRSLAALGAKELAALELLSESIVKKAFRRLALRLHPDQNPTAAPQDFRRARAAYDILVKAVRGTAERM